MDHILVLPNPAAASQSTVGKKVKLSDHIDALKAGSGSVKDQEGEDDQGDTSKRNKGKSDKFAKLRASGRLPKHIEELYQNVPDGVGAPEHRTNAINRLFVKATSTS